MRKNPLLLAFLIFSLLGLVSMAADKNVTGKWEIVIQSDHGEFARVMTFEQEGEVLKVSYEDQEGEGRIKDNEIKWTITLLTPMGNFDADFMGKVKVDEMAGEVSLASMAMDWSARKLD